MVKEAEKTDAGAAAAAGAAPSGMAAWMPIVAVVVLVPVISFAMAEFVLFPRLVERLGGGHEAAPAAGAHGAEGGDSHGGGEHGGAMQSYEFTNVVSNLSGSMKSRYIKVSFTAYSSNPDFLHVVEQNHAKILDTALSVLGSMTLADLEDAAVKNRMRANMVSAFETLLRGRVIEEIYFSEFVVQ